MSKTKVVLSLMLFWQFLGLITLAFNYQMVVDTFNTTKDAMEGILQ